MKFNRTVVGVAALLTAALLSVAVFATAYGAQATAPKQSCYTVCEKGNPARCHRVCPETKKTSDTRPKCTYECVMEPGKPPRCKVSCPRPV